MTLEEVVVSKLEAQASLKRLVGRKIRPFSVAVGEDIPFVLYRRAGETQERYLSGALKAWSTVEIAVTACASDTNTTTQLEAGIKAAMLSVAGTYTGITIRNAGDVLREDDTVPPATGDEVPLIQITLTFAFKVKVS